MSLQLNVYRSDRVKCADLHPNEPWTLISLYNGYVQIWNHENQQLVKTFQVSDVPVRAAKFIGRKNWIVTGSDDMQVRIFNYNTLEKIHQMEAHSDYLRSIAVHPTQPFILTGSDDKLIKLWDWEEEWKLKQIFEGHTHYVMHLAINPKDTNTFATASLDKTIKVWQLGSSVPNCTLEGHLKGVNSVDYYHGGDKPYLISGADDHLIKIWDYQNGTCMATLLDGHSHNVSAVCFHPELPIIISGSEDSTVRIWNANTNRYRNSQKIEKYCVFFFVLQHNSKMGSNNNTDVPYFPVKIITKLEEFYHRMSRRYESSNLKWKIHNLKKIEPKQQRLFFEGIELEEPDYELSLYGIDPIEQNAEFKLMLVQFYQGISQTYFLDESHYDPKWNCSFEGITINKNESRGGKPYIPPIGCVRYGVKVLGKYENDTWLGGKGYRTEDEWPVAYHGTKELNVLYKLIIQCRVDPKKLQIFGNYWLVTDEKHIRPYAICVFFEDGVKELDKYICKYGVMRN